MSPKRAIGAPIENTRLSNTLNVSNHLKHPFFLIALICNRWWTRLIRSQDEYLDHHLQNQTKWIVLTWIAIKISSEVPNRLKGCLCKIKEHLLLSSTTESYRQNQTKWHTLKWKENWRLHLPKTAQIRTIIHPTPQTRHRTIIEVV